MDADLLDIDLTDPDVLANGASFTLDTDAGPVDYLNDLIRMKRASGRPQDLRDIANLSQPVDDG